MAHIQLGIFNADGTNRHKDLNKPDKLAKELGKVVREKLFPGGEDSCILTVSEILPRASSKLYKQLPETFEYYGGKFKSKDGLAYYWNEETWCPKYTNGRAKHIWSDEGKYAAIILKNETTKKRLLYVSVHLPRKDKTKKTKSLGLLGKRIEDKSQSVDGIIIAGDFNMKPTEIWQEFSGLNLGIYDDLFATTKAGNSIDNVATSDAITPIVNVYKDYDKLTHFPLFASLTLKD